MNAEKDRVNLYGAILDCSAPYYMDKTAKYLCTVKLIDDSLHPEGTAKSAKDFLSVTFFGKTAADLPQAAKVGSILRIHRGQSKKYKDGYQMNCDCGIKGKWVLFDPIDGQTPFAKIGRKFTFTEEDKALLAAIRKFAKAHFAKFELPAMTLKEAEKKQPKDFDTLCLVLDVKNKGKGDRVLLCDATKVVKLDLPENRKGCVCPQEVVRVRGAEFAKEGMLKLNDYSNILRVPKDFQSAKELLKELKKDKLPADVKEQLSYHGTDSEVATKVKDDKIKKATPLKKLFGDEMPKGEKKAKVHVSVVEVGPKDPKDWICIFDKKTGEQ